MRLTGINQNTAAGYAMTTIVEGVRGTHNALPVVESTDIDSAANALKAISHPIRLKILCILKNDDLSVQELVDRVGTTQSNISQHLAIMREMQILRTRKQANRVIYRLESAGIIRLVNLLCEMYGDKCSSSS